MPKREIVGYNFLIVCCLWCYTNVISVVSQCLLRLLGQQDSFSCLPSIPGDYSMKTMSTKLTQASKEILARNNINQVLMVNEGKLVKVSVNRVHSVTKGFCKFWVLTKHLLVNTGNHFRTRVYRARLAIQGFCWFGIWSLIISSIDFSWLWWWLLVIVICIEPSWQSELYK